MACVARDDALFTEDERYTAEILELTMQHLQLRSSDLLVDVGGGNGSFASALMQRAIADAKPGSRERQGAAIIVEPDATLLQDAAQKVHVRRVIHAHADAWAAGDHDRAGERCDRVLLKEMLHHLHEHALLFEAFRMNRMAPGARLLIFSRPRCDNGWPMWPEAAARWTQAQPDEQYLSHALSSAGFIEVTTHRHSVPMEVPSAVYAEELRQMWSTWGANNFSDEEIGKGLAWMQSNTQNAEVTRFENRIVLISAAVL